MKKDGKEEFDGKGAARMDEIAQGPFAPIYPVIARQAISYCGIDRGFCIDAGCGPGNLAIALAEISGYTVDALDASEDMFAHAEKNIREAGLEDRIRVVHGDVHELPYKDCSVDLVVSRGSVFFWDDPARAFAEIYRVLRPGGRTFVGGGFGTPELKAAVTMQMREIDPSWEEKARGRMSPEKTDEIMRCLVKARITDVEIIRDEAGFWIVMRK